MFWVELDCTDVAVTEVTVTKDTTGKVTKCYQFADTNGNTRI